MGKALTTEQQFSLDLIDFLEAVNEGMPPIHAAVSLGWTPRQFDRLCADPEFAELLDGAQRYANASIEQMVFKKAKEGSLEAAKFWLTNRSEERWTDRRRDAKDVPATQVNVVIATKEALGATLRQVSAEEIAALGPGGFLDVDEAS